MPPGDLVTVDRTTLRAFVVGDLLAILAFVLVGELNHHVGPRAVRFAGTLVSFYVGWTLLAPLVGAYAARVRESWTALVGRTALAWIGADVVAQALRATALFPGDASVSFFLVAGGFGFLFLTALRVGVRLVGLRRSTDRWTGAS